MKKRNIFSYSPKLDSRGALGPLSMVLVCGSMTKTWVLPISEVFDLFLDKISMAFAACFLIHSSEQKIQPSFGSLSQQKQVFFLTTTWNIKQIHIRYSLIDTNDIIKKGLKYIIYLLSKKEFDNNCISRLKYFLNFLPTHPRYLCYVSHQPILVMTKCECWTFVLKFIYFLSNDLKFIIGPRKLLTISSVLGSWKKNIIKN